MAVELAQPIFIATRMQRLSRQNSTAVYVERQVQQPSPLPVISPEGYPDDLERIGKVNFLLSGAYGLSLAYDEITTKAMKAKTKQRKKNQSAANSLDEFVRDIDDVTEYSLHLSRLLSVYTKGDEAQTQESEVFVNEKTRALFLRKFGSTLPPQREKKIDLQLGLDRFLLSEVLGMGVEVHDIRTPLTVFKGSAQILARKGRVELDEALAALVKERRHAGEHMRKRLLFPLPLQEYPVNKIADMVQGFVQEDAVQQQFGQWNIVMPKGPFIGFPEVPFNEQMLYSILENAFFNAAKGRKLLEEYFGRLFPMPFLAGETLQAKSWALRYLQRIHDRLEQIPTLSIDFVHVVLRRRPYTEIVVRDNGIGNNHRSGRRVWRRNFAIGDSDWSGSHEITGTGIAMGAHRQRIKELFPHTHADMFLRNRTDGEWGAEVVIRLPGEKDSTKL